MDTPLRIFKKCGMTNASYNQIRPGLLRGFLFSFGLIISLVNHQDTVDKINDNLPT